MGWFIIIVGIVVFVAFTIVFFLESGEKTSRDDIKVLDVKINSLRERYLSVLDDSIESKIAFGKVNLKHTENYKELKARIDQLEKIVTPKTTLEKIYISTFSEGHDSYRCKVCGHKHDTPVPKCWGCGREVENYQCSEIRDV